MDTRRRGFRGGRDERWRRHYRVIRLKRCQYPVAQLECEFYFLRRLRQMTSERGLAIRLVP
jgi:hypothetical protein